MADIHGPGRTLPASDSSNEGEVVVVDSTVAEGVTFKAAGTAKFTPTTAGNWGTHVPTTIQGALDTIASMITIS